MQSAECRMQSAECRVVVNFLAMLGNFRFLLKDNSGKVFVHLFQKVAEHEAEPRTNARASALASVLQNREALLLDFGQSQYFPNVGKYCALSPPARFARGIAIEFSFFCGCIQVISRPHRDFADIRIILYLQIGTHPLAPPPLNGEGEVREREPFVQRSEYRYRCLRHEIYRLWRYDMVLAYGKPRLCLGG